MIQEIYTTYSIEAGDIIYACQNLEEWSMEVAKKYEGIGFKG